MSRVTKSKTETKRNLTQTENVKPLCCNKTHEPH